MFEGIGKINNYLNMRNLKIDAQYRISTGQSLSQLQENLQKRQTMMKAPKAKKTSMSDTLKINLIKDKLKQGRELSANELMYLRENDTALYRKAKNVAQAREELKRDLKTAKTKNEARSAVMRAQMKAANEALAEIAAMQNSKGGAEIPSGNGYEAGSEVTGGSADFQEKEGLTAGGESLEAAVTETQTDEAEISDADAKQMLGTILQSINEAVNNATAEEKIAAENDQKTEQTDGTDNNPEDKRTVDDIVEELMYKLKAIQNEWENYIKTKEYKNLSENGETDNRNSNETILLDAVMSYKANKKTDISLLDMEQ